MKVGSAAELAALDHAPGLLVQEFLPGEEFSIDVLAGADGHVIASVPRLRARVDSGVSVGGRTVHDPELESFGRAVAEATGITYVANVQCQARRGGPSRRCSRSTRGCRARSGSPSPAASTCPGSRSPRCAASRSRRRSASASRPWCASSTSASLDPAEIEHLERTSRVTPA